MKNKNIALIKINSKTLIKLKKSQGGRDFLFVYSPIISGEAKIVSHFTFHVPNARITFKIIKMFLSGKDITSAKFNEAKKQAVFVEKIGLKDLDLFYTSNNQKEFVENYQKLFQIALNFTGGHSVSDYFMESKIKDSKFSKDLISDISLPKDKEQITLYWFVSKGPNYKIPRILEDNHDKVISIEETDCNGSKIIFLLGIIFSFPTEIKK